MGILQCWLKIIFPIMIEIKVKKYKNILLTIKIIRKNKKQKNLNYPHNNNQRLNTRTGA